MASPTGVHELLYKVTPSGKYGTEEKGLHLKTKQIINEAILTLSNLNFCTQTCYNSGGLEGNSD